MEGVLIHNRLQRIRDVYVRFVHRHSSVGITTRYGLNGLGINSGGDEIFRTRSDRPWGSPSLLSTGYRVSYLRVKRQGCGAGNPPSSRAEVKERVEQKGLQCMLQGKLYIYSSDGTTVARSSRGLYRSTGYTKWLQFLLLSRTMSPMFHSSVIPTPCSSVTCYGAHRQSKWLQYR